MAFKTTLSSLSKKAFLICISLIALTATFERVNAQQIRHLRGTSVSTDHNFLMTASVERLHDLTLLWDFSLSFQIDGSVKQYTMDDIEYIRRTPMNPLSQTKNWMSLGEKADAGIDLFFKDGGRVHLFRDLEGATLELSNFEGSQGFIFDDAMVKSSSNLLDVHPSKTMHNYIHVTGLGVRFEHRNRMSREGLYRAISEELEARVRGLQMGVHRGKTCQGLLTPFLVIDGGRE